MSLDFDFMFGTKPMKHAANSREINYVDETAFHMRKEIVFHFEIPLGGRVRKQTPFAS